VAELAVREVGFERALANRVPDPTVGLRAFRDRSGAERGVGVFISLPLPGAARAADERLAQAQTQEAEQRLQATLRRVRTEALATHTAARQGLETWQRLLAARRNAEGSATLAARAFELGEGTLTELLIARQGALDAAVLEAGARIDAIEAHVRLLVDAHRLWNDEAAP
jgi:outer membrane protein TolC